MVKTLAELNWRLWHGMEAWKYFTKVLGSDLDIETWQTEGRKCFRSAGVYRSCGSGTGFELIMGIPKVQK